MQVANAITILEDVAVDYDSDILGVMEYMKDNLSDFAPMEVLAFRTLFAEFKKLFV